MRGRFVSWARIALHVVIPTAPRARSPVPADGAARTVEPRSPAHGRGRLTRRLLLAADAVGLTAAFLVSHLVRGGALSGRESVVFALVLPLWLAATQLAGLYDRDARCPGHSTAEDLPGVVVVVTTGTWLYWMAASWASALGAGVARLTAFWALAIAFVVAGRAVGRALARRRALFVENAVIVGTGDLATLVSRKLLRHPEFGIRVVGFVGKRPAKGETAVLGPVERLPQLVDALEIDRVIVALPDDPDGRLLDVVHRLRTQAAQIDVVPALFEAVDPGVALHAIEGLPLVGLPPVRTSTAARATKRTVDVLLAGAGLVLLAPLFACIAWRVKRDSPGPVFFRQTRLGLHMRPFTTLKFRTMWEGSDPARHRDYIRSTMSGGAAAESNGLFKLERREDVTPFGRFLRRTSLDELPQLFNVLRGEMSLVGPRPCIPYETECFAPHHFDRFLVPAGLTGLWQVTARARATFGEELEMDVAYAHGRSLGLDLRLLLQTPLAVLRQAATT